MVSFAIKTGAAAAWVQRVHLHPFISSNGCNEPVLKADFHTMDHEKY